jgi:hypothetical protein
MEFLKINVTYDFYNDYINNRNSINNSNKSFSDILTKRINDVKHKYFIKNKSDNDIIKDYFVEIFSWSVLTPQVLSILDKHIKNYNFNSIIDPCCGNAFHTYLFKTILDLNVYSVDIQDEPNSWTEINEVEGRTFMKSLSNEQHSKNILLLSWIDYESLTIELLDLYRGNMVISIGNYDGLSPNYIKQLNKKFKLIDTIILYMPWDLNEKIEIYIKNLE